MLIPWLLALASALTAADAAPPPDKPAKSNEAVRTPHPDVHKNHVRKTSSDYLSNFRRITWHYDFATAAQLARDTQRPMFVIFCRAGEINDARTGKPKCAS